MGVGGGGNGSWCVSLLHVLDVDLWRHADVSCCFDRR